MSDAHRKNGRLEGKCMCGAVTVQVDGDYSAAVGLCHCQMCQHWNGVAFGCFAVPPESVTITGPAQRFASSKFAERAFCSTCGSHLWMRTTQPPEDYEFMPGLFPDAADFPLISEIYSDLAPAYVPIAGSHKRASRAEYEANNPFVEGDTP